MADGYEAKGGLMRDVITNVLGDIFDFFNVNIDPADFEHYLGENGFMVVPIEESFAPRTRDEDEDG